MNNLIKENWFKIAIIILIVIGGIFYWFEWKPTQIRRNCGNECLGFKSIFNKNCYSECMHKSGLDE